MADQSAAVDDLLSKQQKPAEDPNSKVGGAELAKVALGLVVCLASIVLFVRRIPHHEYVQAHADKPRPPRVVAESDSDVPKPTSAPKPAAAPATAAKTMPGKPVAAAAKGVSAAQAPAADKSVVILELEDACAAEAPLLCYHVAAPRLPRCLSQYDDALRKSCRQAVEDKLSALDNKPR